MGKRLEQTAEFLKDVLGEGPLPSQQAWEEAQRAGYSRRTYDRARKALLVQAKRRGWGSRGAWEVSLLPPGLQFLDQVSDSKRTPNVARLENGSDRHSPAHIRVS